MMSLYEALGNFIFSLKCELMCCELIDVIIQANGLESAIFGGIKIFERASDD